MPIPIRLSLATLVLAALLLARPFSVNAADGPRPGGDVSVSAYQTSGSASLISPHHPLDVGSTLSTTKMVGLIVACFLPALLLVLRERNAIRLRNERAR